MDATKGEEVTPLLRTLSPRRSRFRHTAWAASTTGPQLRAVPTAARCAGSQRAGLSGAHVSTSPEGFSIPHWVQAAEREEKVPPVSAATPADTWPLGTWISTGLGGQDNPLARTLTRPS